MSPPASVSLTLAGGKKLVKAIMILSFKKLLLIFFGHGYLKPKYDIDSLEAAKSSRIVNRYVVNQHSVITEFIDKYPMLTRKHLDYLD